MKEHPILFSGPLVRAILEGRKTQTRRIVKPQPVASPGYEHATAFHADTEYSRALGATFAGRDTNPLRWWFADASGPRAAYACPYGSPGDRMWVRETWCLAHPDYHDTDKEAGTRPVKDGRFCFYAATDDVDTGDGSPWKPSIHMPRWASRITLEVTAVSAERLQAISEADAQAEGVDRYAGACDHPRFGCDEIDCLGQTHRASFAALWDAINGDRAAWASNPWVWVIEFKRIGGAS